MSMLAPLVQFRPLMKLPCILRSQWAVTWPPVVRAGAMPSALRDLLWWNANARRPVCSGVLGAGEG